jgi:hypothetical protein
VTSGIARSPPDCSQWGTFVEVNRAVASAFFAIGEYESTRKHLADAAAAAEAGDDEVLLAEIAMQQSHVLNMYGGSLEDAVRFGRRALEIATRLDDEALAYGARFALGQTGWIGGDYFAAIQFLTANLPENVRDTATRRRAHCCADLFPQRTVGRRGFSTSR